MLQHAESETELLTGKASLELASLHVVEVDDAVDVASCGQLPAARVGQSLHQFLARSEIAGVTPQRGGLSAICTVLNRHGAQAELSCEDLRAIGAEVDLPRLSLLCTCLTK